MVAALTSTLFRAAFGGGNFSAGSAALTVAAWLCCALSSASRAARSYVL